MSSDTLNRPSCLGKSQEEELDAIFSELDGDSEPGAVVGVNISGRPVYLRAFGLAHAELPVKLTPQMKLRIASTTKHFTSLAYLLLCEDGLVQLDDEVALHLPELKGALGDTTVRHLMAHVSGLRDVKDLTLLFNGVGHRITQGRMISLYKGISERNAAANETWIYNNGGYMLITAIIERVTGISLEAFFEKRIFRPLKMSNTQLRRWDTDFVPNSASLHTRNPEGTFEKKYLGVASAGEGGIVSSAEDMLTWLAHMAAPTVGSASSWRAIKTPHVLANGVDTSYGLGLMVSQYRGFTALSHPGGVLGGNCQMITIPDLRLDAVVIANRDDVSAERLARRVLNIFLKVEDEHEDNSAGERLEIGTDTYHSPTSGRVVRIGQKCGQVVALIDGTEVPLEKSGDGLLPASQAIGHTNLVLKVDIEKSVLDISDFGNVDRLHRVNCEASKIDELVGTYSSAEAQAIAELTHDEHGSILSVRGLVGSAEYRLESLAGEHWYATSTDPIVPLGTVISVNADRDELFLTSSRTRRLRFRRDV